MLRTWLKNDENSLKMQYTRSSSNKELYLHVVSILWLDHKIFVICLYIARTALRSNGVEYEYIRHCGLSVNNDYCVSVHSVETFLYCYTSAEYSTV